MEGDQEKQEKEGRLNQPPQMTPMKPLTRDAYGGGMYGNEPEPMQDRDKPSKPPASETQSADGPAEKPDFQPKHQPPPSTGDRDLDITGQSYIHLDCSCGLKVDTRDPKWHKTLTKVLKRIRGVSYTIDAEEGTALITGRVDPNKLLKKLSKGGKHTDICWIETGNMNMNNAYQYYPHGGYLQPGPGYHQGYHPGYAVTNYYPQRPPPRYGYGYGYGYDHHSYPYPTWA
ncbi:unnamed protein product [Dovyalis caffra]|uniref:HMA domain-containing protein n=1 Tax=Dovyalis caffra TaxID=77055 RepID=A0AAV1S6B3_9ROSI|nr:unnamed protein product [Dovyalis caffra]